MKNFVLMIILAVSIMSCEKEPLECELRQINQYEIFSVQFDYQIDKWVHVLYLHVDNNNISAESKLIDNYNSWLDFCPDNAPVCNEDYYYKYNVFSPNLSNPDAIIVSDNIYVDFGSSPLTSPIGDLRYYLLEHDMNISIINQDSITIIN